VPDIVSNIQSVAYKEVARVMGVSILECKLNYRVSRRINKLTSLLNFLHNNLCFTNSSGECDKTLIVNNGAGIITIKFVDDVTGTVHDVWYFRCSKENFNISDELETYFISSKLCQKTSVNTKTLYSYSGTTVCVYLKQAIYRIHQVLPYPEVKFYSIKRFLKSTCFYYGDYAIVLKHIA
jgi:hypothetical protein